MSVCSLPQLINYVSHRGFSKNAFMHGFTYPVIHSIGRLRVLEGYRSGVMKSRVLCHSSQMVSCTWCPAGKC